MDAADVLELSPAKEEGVKVCVRVRPLNARETETEGTQGAWTVAENQIKNASGVGTFEFDHIFVPPSSNRVVYNAVGASLVKSAVDGFNGVIFAYGQTSSGKTHTMLGCEGDSGITPLAISDVFEHVTNSQDREFLIRVSYIEIYNENIRDLLCPGQDNLKIHEDFTGRVFVDAREEVVTCAEDVLKIMKEGEEQRTFGSTNMNERSSRSHTIFTVIIESRVRADLKNADEGVSVCASTLSLVDLAGSERVSHTGAEGVRLKEGGHINKSLLTLGTVINKLSSEGASGHVPYRDAKLTRILQPALGGNARTSIICAVTPAKMHVEETASTLKFASRAKCVQNKTSRIEILDDRAMLRRCQKELEDAKRQLAAAESASQVESQAPHVDVERLQKKLEEEEKLSKQLREKSEKLARMLALSTPGGENEDETKSLKRQRTSRRQTIGVDASDQKHTDGAEQSERMQRLAEDLAKSEKRSAEAASELGKRKRHMEMEYQALRNEVEALETHAADLERTQKIAETEASMVGERVAAAQIVGIVDEIIAGAMVESEFRAHANMRKSFKEVQDEKDKIQKDLDCSLKKERVGTAPLQKQIDMLKTKLADTEAKLKAAKSVSSSLQAEKLQFEKDQKSMSKQIRTMDGMKAKELDKALRESERAKENEIRGKDVQIDALSEEVERQRQQAVKQQEEMKVLNESLSRVEMDLKQKEVELEEVVVSNRELQKNIDAQNSTIEKKDAEMEKLRQIGKEKEKELNEALEEEIEEVRLANEKAEGLSEEVAKLNKALSADKDEMEQQKTALADALNSLKTAETSKDEVNEELKKLKESSEKELARAAEEAKQLLTQRVEPLELRIQEEQAQAQEARDEGERLREDVAEKSKQLSQAQTETENVKETLKVREDEVRLLNESVAQLRSELDKSAEDSSVRSDLEREVSSLREKHSLLRDETAKLKENLENAEENCSRLQNEAAANAKEKVRLVERYQDVEKKKRKLELGLETWESGSGRVGTLERKLQRREIKVKRLENQLKRMEERMVLEGRAQDWLEGLKISDLEARAESAAMENENTQKRLVSMEAERMSLIRETHKLRDEIALRDRSYAELVARQLAIAAAPVLFPTNTVNQQVEAENLPRFAAKPPRCPPTKRAALREVQVTHEPAV